MHWKLNYCSTAKFCSEACPWETPQSPFSVTHCTLYPEPSTPTWIQARVLYENDISGDD